MNGILVIDKVSGKTSRDIVNIVCHKFNTKKVGHMGTLDPLATGVLVLALGTATKIISLIDNVSKSYVATSSMGYQTDTLDSTGKTIATAEVKDDYPLEEVLKSFEKTYLQEIPKYSAKKIAGKKLYEYARNNEEITLPFKEVTIEKINLISKTSKEFTFSCTVSKGTFIRSLIRDIGVLLNIPCTMSSLRRTRQGSFLVEDAYSMEQIENFPVNEIKLLKIEDVLSEYDKIIVSDEIAFKIMNGVYLQKNIKKDYVLFMDKNNKLLAIYQKTHNNNLIKPFYVFHDSL